ncbi:amidase [Chloroflexota bacterium]
MNSENYLLSISDIHRLLQKGALSIDQVLEKYFDRIRRSERLINAFIKVLENQKAEFDPSKPLSGIPIGVKDLFKVKGTATTAGTKFYRNNTSKKNAAIVKEIVKAGGFIIGKTNMHEIALGVTNINTHYGTCRNPWDLKRITGGSSGGSAAAVVSGMCVAALGSDTGGSIRIPSSLCGVVGFKPTYGRVSLGGVIPLSWNLDHVGPITNCVRDAAIVLQTIAGFDENDPASVDIPVDDYVSHLDDGIEGVRIAFITGEYIEKAEKEILQSVKETEIILKSLNTRTTHVEIPWLKKAAVANGLITTADAAAVYLERIETSPGDFGEDVLKRLRIGKSYSSSDYSIARRTQVELNRKFEHVFNEFDLLILPTTPVAAPLIEGSDAIEQARSLTRFTAPFNLVGLPAISIPCGFTNDGLPIGLQIVGRFWNERLVLMAAHAYEKSTSWMNRKSIPELE